MNLSRYGVEYYDPDPQTTPALTGWQASFDNGETWVDSTEHPDTERPVWLVAGAEATTPGDAIVLTATVKPHLLALDDPETIVRTGPTINVTR